VTTLLGHKSGVTGVAFNCTGTLVASSSSDGTVQVWSTACLEAGAKPLRTLVGHRAGVHCIAFDPLDPDRLASGSQDQRLIIWSISESASKLKLVSNDHKGVHSVSFR
jgi:WD40 repeat protein